MVPTRKRATMLRDSTAVDRRRFIELAGSAGAVGLAGCTGGSDGGGGDGGGDGGDGGGSQGTTQAGVTSFDMAISHYPIISNGLPVMVSKEEGLYADRDIGVEGITSFSGGGTTIRGVVTGGLPVGGGAAASVVKAWKAGAPVNFVGGLANTNDIDVVVLADSEVETIQDLKGKTIGFTNPGSSSQAMLTMSFKRAEGISLSVVTLEAMGGLGETITGLNEGAIDAGWNNIAVSIPKVEAGEWRRVFGTWEYAPAIPNSALFAGTPTIDEHGDFFGRFIDAHVEANEIIKNERDTAAAAWAKRADNIDQSLARKVIDLSIDEISENMFGVGWNERAFHSLEEEMLTIDLISSPPQWDQVVDQQFIPEDERIELPS